MIDTDKSRIAKVTEPLADETSLALKDIFTDSKGMLFVYLDER